MKKKDKITWMHVEAVPEIPEEKIKLSQSEKWLVAMWKAPMWKKDEYAAQSIVWEEYEKEPWLEHVNPLARA